MKKQNVSFQLNQAPEQGQPLRLPAVVGGILLLLGIGGLGGQCLRPEPAAFLLPAALLTAGGYAAGLLLCWNRPRQRLALYAMWLLLAAAGLALRERVLSALAELGNLLSSWIFLQTGYYTPPYPHAGGVWLLLLPAGAALGFLVGSVVRLSARPWILSAVAAVALALRLGSYLPSGVFFACLLLGVLFGFVPDSATGKPARTRGFLALVVAVCLAGQCFLPESTAPAESTAVSRALHRLQYERAADPLPEGQLSGSVIRAGDNTPALQLTMEHWTPLYLRGYVAGSYTGTGWEQPTAQTLADEAATLYSLQSGYFLPAQQLSCAAGDTDAGSRISLQVLNACRSVTYLPYGVGSLPSGVLDTRDLAGEGMSAPDSLSYDATVYPVEDSYLLQKRLADDDQTDTDYRQAESVYRQWVYAQYLAVPQSTYEVLASEFSPSTEWNTTQAKAEILRFLSENMTYQESVVTPSCEDVAASLLTGEMRGSSVHYATLAALLLRCCGIPARYVEGYVVTEQQAGAMADGATLTLTQRAAHAWAEYYLDGVGWLPFDATPGYENIVTYQLPDTGGSGVSGSGGSGAAESSDAPQNEPDISPEPEEEPDRQMHLYWILLAALLLLTVVILMTRTVLRRRKLLCRRRRFDDPDGTVACQAMLTALQDYLFALDPATDWSAASPGRAQALAALLGASSAREMTELELEAWFSRHPMDETRRQQARALLTETQQLWHRSTPTLRRWIQRFFTCQVI